MSFEMSLKSPELRRSSAIIELAPKCSFNSESDGTITKWLTPDITQPSDADIQVKVDEFATAWDAQEYARNRELEYVLLNQFEMQFDDELNDTTTWKDAINAIKAKYPKP